MKGFLTLEKRYGITVETDGSLIRNGKLVETFKIFAADGCPWENGLTRKGVKAECEIWGKDLLKIKDMVRRENV